MSEGMTTKERREQKRMKEILDAAQEIFTEKGFEGVTINEIADRALAAKSTVYEYFESKSEILTEIVARGFSLLSEYVQRKIAGVDDPRERIVALIRAELRFFEKRIAFFEMLSLDRPEFGRKTTSVVVPAYSEHIAMIEKEVQRGIDAGSVRADVANDTAHLVFAAVQTFTLRWLVEGKKGSLTEKADALAAILLDGISNRPLA